MGKTTTVRRELKRTLIPLLESKGFSIDMADAPMFVRFRRTEGVTVHLLEVQWDKYGSARFAINVGKCPSEGLQFRGERLPVEKVCAGWLEEHGRLQPTRGRHRPGWFCQERSLLKRLAGKEKLRTPEEIVAHLVRLLPEVEAYWTSGEVGRHLMIMRIPRP